MYKGKKREKKVDPKSKRQERTSQKLVALDGNGVRERRLKV
jgi:hypothetical protein